MKSYIHYIVERRDLEVRWVNAVRGAVFKKGPQADKNGQIHLFGKPYAPDPRRNRHRIIRRYTLLPWPLDEHFYAYFVEGIPTQMPGFRDFPQTKVMEDALSSSIDTFKKAAESSLTSKWLRPAVDWVMMLFGVGTGFGIGAVAASLIMKWKG